MASPPESRDGDVAPPPLDLSHHWSQVANHRTMSSMKRFYKYFQIPGVANLAAGASLLLSILHKPSPPNIHVQVIAGATYRCHVRRAAPFLC